MLNPFRVGDFKNFQIRYRRSKILRSRDERVKKGRNLASPHLELQMRVIDVPVLSHLRGVEAVVRAVQALLLDPRLVAARVVPQGRRVDRHEAALVAARQFRRRHQRRRRLLRLIGGHAAAAAGAVVFALALLGGRPFGHDEAVLELPELGRQLDRSARVLLDGLWLLRVLRGDVLQDHGPRVAAAVAVRAEVVEPAQMLQLDVALEAAPLDERHAAVLAGQGLLEVLVGHCPKRERERFEEGDMSWVMFSRTMVLGFVRWQCCRVEAMSYNTSTTETFRCEVKLCKVGPRPTSTMRSTSSQVRFEL